MPDPPPPSPAGSTRPTSRPTDPAQGLMKKEPIIQRLGNYYIGQEVGRGSFATVHKAYRSKPQDVVAIKAVSRSKLTSKLMENLESEINILKAINHRNIVGLEDCFKTESHIYLVMEYCTGSDLSFYIKQRGKLDTLEFTPRPGMFPTLKPLRTNEQGKTFWPHPPSGGIDERVTRCFLGQLAKALKFLRSQNLIHRDIKPQNLLMQPPTAFEIADGHPLGIPVLKIADFGFARILPAAAMAETLCGSPLYMAPEILRYEKYDAKADLWSVGAVLYEMAVGKPPFRANNHVELLRRIEKGEDRIKFPDESPQFHDPTARNLPSVPPREDIKHLIRQLLKRKPAERMDFPDFFDSAVWDGYMSESQSSSGGDSLSPDVLSIADSSEMQGAGSERLRRAREIRKAREAEAELKLKEAVEREKARFEEGGKKREQEEKDKAKEKEQQKEAMRSSWSGKGNPIPPHRRPVMIDPKTRLPVLVPKPIPPRTPQPTQQVSPADTPLPTSTPPTPPTPSAQPPPGDRHSPSQQRPPTPPPSRPEVQTPAVQPPPVQALPPRPVVHRSEPKYYVSDPAPAASPPSRPPVRAPSTPSVDQAHSRPIVSLDRRYSGNAGASPDEPTPVTPSSVHPPPFNRARVSEGSPLASTPPITMSRDDDSALEGSDSVVGREYVMVEKQTVEVNALADEFDQASRANQALIRRTSSRISVVSRPVSALRPSISSGSQDTTRPALPTSYSPPFAMSPARRPSFTNTTPSSVPQMTVFPPPAPIGYSPESQVARYGVSPSSLQTGALARALTNTAIRMIGHGANTAATALARATAKRRPTIIRTGDLDEEEENLLKTVEDVARKAFVLFELGDARLAMWNALARISATIAAGAAAGPSSRADGGSPFANDSSSLRRKSSSSSAGSELLRLRDQETAAGEACVLYYKALGFIVKGTNMIQRYWEEGGSAGKAGAELNEMVQWLRARFNECYEKADWAKARCAEELPFIERLLHEKARETSRNAALAELQGDLPSAEVGYENALWLLMTLLDEAMYDGGDVRDEDRAGVEKMINPIRTRLESLRRKMAETTPS